MKYLQLKHMTDLFKKLTSKVYQHQFNLNITPYTKNINMNNYQLETCTEI